MLPEQTLLRAGSDDAFRSVHRFGYLEKVLIILHHNRILLLARHEQHEQRKQKHEQQKMTIDYSRFDAIRIDTSSSESSSPKSSSTSPLGKRISDEEAKVLRTTFTDAKRVPCTTHRRTNNLLLLLTDRAERVHALAGYAKAFNLPQTETWVVPLLDERRRVLWNEHVSSSSSDLEDDDDDDIDDLKNANSNNINDFSRRKRRRRLRRVVCDIALVAADALDFDLETQIHFLACGREASLAAMEACAIFGELFEGAGGAFMINDVDDETCVDTGRCMSTSISMALKTFGGGFVRTIERRKKRREDVRRKTRMTFLQYSTAASKNKLKDASTSLDNPEFFRRNYFETFHHESARTPLESEKENCLIANETEARILFSHLGKTLKQTPDDPDVVDLTRRPREEKSYAYDFDVSSHPRRKLVAKIGDLNDVFEAMFVRRVGVSQKARSATKD